MNKSLVRCWVMKNVRARGGAVELYISYPEDNSGHDLFSCLKCGHIYCASVVKQVYVGPPLEEKIMHLQCVECAANLAATLAPYPENYVVDGEVFKFVRPIEFPPDEVSIVKEFDDIYS